ncbi:hypothetical protein EG328_001114 [Venturia inaequalis]|uniref:Uncharacterized protein n=1 Tax=Venturia inaequalis TaxID=5025 RepID=A0A8H3YIS1_VENIN|nr:hypothetical protein EG328_001114 [Venturia inaequalis]KAE9974017.1 hypothetical protein EG327_008914 [Venturia inaequalis]RDI80442.1 hypothetical protein Vi05172_g9543 [Venturia inaequalis]
MLDSNLPTYYFKPSADKNRPYEASLLFTQFDSEPEAKYTLLQPDPAAPIAKNCYATALFDAHISEILFGEVLVKPEWTQPSISQEEIRKNGGIPPRPQPVIPSSFAVQLYSPEQQIEVTEKSGSWGSTPSYTFSMPQYTFRTPSSSVLDRAGNDPAVDPATPQINFLWKRDGKKDMQCYLTGKSTDKGKKKKGGKEPDIQIAMFSGMRDLTIYEPNLHRVEMEDYKGLEVVLLLSATVIRDVYCGLKKDCFNVGEAPRKNSSGVVIRRKPSAAVLLSNGNGPSLPSRPQDQHLANVSASSRLHLQKTTSGPPPPDPRAEWEIEAETVRLRKQTEAEKRQIEAHRRELLKRDEEEAKRVQKLLEAEDKERRRRQVEVDRETERLRRQYGDQSNMMTSRPSKRQSFPGPAERPQQPARPIRNQQRSQSRPAASGPYLQGGAAPFASQSSFFHGSSAPPPIFSRPRPTASQSGFFHGSGALQPAPPQNKPKKSFFGLRGLSESSVQKLSR